MMLAFVGLLFSANAQEKTNSFQAQELKTAVTEKGDHDVDAAAELSKKLSHQHSSDPGDPLGQLKDFMHRSVQGRNEHEMIDYIHSNPWIRSYLNRNEHLLYSMGLSNHDLNYIRAYLSSTGK